MRTLSPASLAFRREAGSYRMTSRITRNFDGPDALPIGTPSAPHLPAAQVSLYGEATDYVRGQELYAMRVRPELFEGMDTDLWIDTARREARSTGRLVYDCHRCHITHLIAPDATRCPMAHPIED